MFQLKAYVFQGLVALRLGWIIAYISTGLIAVWEIVSGDHLPGAYVSAQLLREQLYAISTTIAVVISTFENPDTYAIFIAAAFPFLLTKGLASVMTEKLWL